MNIWKNRLSLLLVVQLLVAGGLWAWSQRYESTRTAETKLFSVQMDSVDKLEISEGEETLSLTKKDGTWVLPDKYATPIDKGKLDTLLSGLEELAVGTPETTTDSSHERLGLGEKPTARLQLFRGDDLVADLLLGKTPSFGQRYLRLAGEERAYRARWSGMNVQAQAKSWLANDLLELDTVQKVRFPDFELAHSGQAWKTADKELDTTRVDQLLTPLKKLRILDVVEVPVPENAFSLEVETGKQTYHYRFFQDSDKRYLKRDDFEQVFQISSEVHQKVTGAKLEDLLPEPPAEASGGKSAPPEADN